MVVGVHQTGVHKAVGGVDDAVRRALLRPDVSDHVVLHQDVFAPQHPVLPVHGDDGLGIADESGRHRSRSFSVKTR